MYGGGSRQPIWPGMHGSKAHSPTQAARADSASEQSSVSDFLAKEREQHAVSGPAADTAKAGAEHTLASAKAAPVSRDSTDSADKAKDKTKPSSGNLAVVAAVGLLGFAAFSLGQGVVVGLRMLSPAAERAVYSIKTDNSEYAEAMRRLRRVEQEALEHDQAQAVDAAVDLGQETQQRWAP